MKKYNIGLDIGTTSVGWAVVEDGTQKIMRKGKKALWGVRLFEEAQTAAERRGYRSTRRRYDRRRNRIKLLQEEFNSEINKVDSNFFIKLKESKYLEQDEKNKTIKLTKEEKRDTRLLNASRRQRIAKGSGTTVQDINKFIKSFEMTQKMMKKVQNGKGKGMKNMLKGIDVNSLKDFKM